MARGSEMQQVEFHDASSDVAAEPAPSSSRRRWGWGVAGVALVAVTGLVASQLLADHREDAAVARLRALPGVTEPVGPHLTASPADEKTVRELTGWGVADVAADGSQSLTWKPDGGAGWTVHLTAPRRALAVDGAHSSTSCQSDRASERRYVVCGVTDGGWVPASAGGDGAYTEVPSTRDEVVVLAAADGTVVTRWPVPRQATLAVVDDVVAVGAQVGEHPVVTAYDVSTGSQRWTHRPTNVAYRADAQGPSVYVNRAGAFVVVQGFGSAVEVLRSDGTQVRTIGDTDAPEGSSYVSCGDDDAVGPVCTSSDGAGGEQVILLGDDAEPSHDRRLTGSLVNRSVDDGSVPGLVLTYDCSLHAWDAASGNLRWQVGCSRDRAASDEVQPDGALVLRGVVYCVTDGALVAIDGRTGERRWTGEDVPGARPTGLFTDGRQVMATYEPGGGASFLVAFDARSGERVFRAAYPPGIDHLQVVGHQLAGYPDQTDGSPEFSLVS